MNILFYTRENTSLFNHYNIEKLIAQRPQHHYSFVIIKNKPDLFCPWKKLKRLAAEFRDGQNLFRQDIKVLENRIKARFPALKQKTFPAFFVPQVNDEKSIEAISNNEPDLIIQAGAGILTKEIFSIAKKACLNIHHGYSPEIRGINSTFWCLFYGLYDLIGVTCHRIDETLDTGDVYFQYKYDYAPGDSFVDIQEMLCLKGAELLIATVDLFELDVDFEKESKMVDSFYFSNVNYVDYNLLKRNYFRSCGDKTELKTKRKLKVIFKPKKKV